MGIEHTRLEHYIIMASLYPPAGARRRQESIPAPFGPVAPPHGNLSNLAAGDPNYSEVSELFI